MKRILSLLFLINFALCLFAQERTVNIAGTGVLVDITSTKNVAYLGGTLDRLIPTTRDTIDYYVQVSNYGTGPIHFYAAFTLAPISGPDTTISLTVLGKKFGNETYGTVKAAVTSSAVTSELIVTSTSLGTINASDTTGLKNYTSYKPNTLVYNKYILFRLILKGNDSVGTGIQIKRVELQLFQ
jgi:hypothetical protein